MKTIGMFYKNSSDMVNAYREHSQKFNNYAREYGSVTVNPSKMTIIIDDVRRMYFSFPNCDEINNIAGIEFDAIFSEVVDPQAKQFIMTRFRPRLN